MNTMTTELRGRTTVASTSSRLTGRRRDQLSLGLLVSAQFLVMLDTSIVNVALPSIQSELGFGPAGVTWVVNAYVLAFAGLLLLSGRAADLFGRRRLFVGGACLFTVGTLLAALAVNQEMLIAGRAVQGVGAAALSPAAMSLLLATFPAAQRGRAMGAWGAASTLGGATGVVAGGVLAGTVGWRAVFLVTVPVSTVAVLLARRLLAEDVPGVRRTFDWAGAAVLTAAVIALVHGAVDGVDHAWTSPRVAGLLAGSVVLMAAFLAIEHRAQDPLIPLELFRLRALRWGTALALLGGATRASTFVLVALYFQQVLAMSPEQAGFAMVPTSLTGFGVSLFVLPRVLGAMGPARSLVLGLVVLAVGHLWLAYAPSSSGYVVAVLPGLLFVATGVALSFTPTTMVLASSVPTSHTGLASGLAAASMQVGAAVGTAAFIVVGAAAGGRTEGALDAGGFSAAFTAAAAVALLTAAIGWVSRDLELDTAASGALRPPKPHHVRNEAFMSSLRKYASSAIGPTRTRVGTAAWVQDTNGWLTPSERRQLLRPLAAAHLRNLTGRTRLALHLHPGRHSHVEPERLDPPRTVLARRAEEAAARRLPPALLHHSWRTYRYGRALGIVTGTDVDEELLYAAALLHDTGLLASSGDADFTLESARVARTVAEQVGLSKEATTVVLDAIALHHSPGIGCEHGTVAQLLSAGAAVDVIGLHAWQLPDDVLSDAVNLHPREAFKDVFTQAFRSEAARVPQGRAQLLHRYGAFAAAIRLAPFAE